MEWVSRWFNVPLMSEPLNWAVIFVTATFWLLAFHVIMQGFGLMQAGGGRQKAFNNTAGLVAAPLAAPEFLSNASVSGFAAFDTQPMKAANLSPWGQQGGQGWGITWPEPVFAEDGAAENWG